MNVLGRTALVMLIWYIALYFTTEPSDMWHTISLAIVLASIFVFIAFGEKRE